MPSLPMRSPHEWLKATAAGTAAFWSTNLLVSLTPTAAAYRSAMGIDHVAMLAEAALGGLVIAGAVSAVMVWRSERIPGPGPMRQALLLSGVALVLLTVLVEVPSKLTTGVADAGRWLLVASVFNVVRVTALGLAVGGVVGGGTARSRRRPAAEGGSR